jgi:hypothetical protein
MNNKEIMDIEKDIESLDDIKEWSTKLGHMKNIKEKLVLQKNKINNLIDVIQSDKIKKNKKYKDLSIDDIINEIHTSKDIENKVKLFIQLQAIIKSTEIQTQRVVN